MTGSKITRAAQKRCALHTMQDQLIAHLDELLAARRAELAADQSDVTAAFEADRAWSGQHMRLENHKGWDDTSIEP